MFLFFVRAFNDIDHMTPVVWKMKCEGHPVALYCLNPEYDIAHDYRLEFLKREGVAVGMLYDHFDQGLGPLHALFRWLTLNAYALQRRLERPARTSPNMIKKAFRLAFHRIGVALYKYTRGRYYDRQWAHRLLALSGAKALCFDWVRPRQYVVAALLDAASDLGIATFALPHGVYVYTNDPITIESRPLETFDKLNKYDCVVVQNNLYKEVMSRTGLKPDKIHVLGSARYCDEWVQLNRTRFPRTMAERAPATDGLKTVLMTTKLRYRVHAARLLKTIDLLARISSVRAVVKPHTRTTKEARMYEDLPIATMAESSSVELCQWADVVLVIGSSIIIEPLLQGKPCLYLKYLHENTTLYEDFGACWIINSEQELEDALRRLVHDKTRVPYAASDVERFLVDIIKGGQPDRDVLQDYVRFIAGWRHRGSESDERIRDKTPQNV